MTGWLAVEVAQHRRVAHVGYLVMGVDATHAGRGIGAALLTEAMQEARRRELRRLELTVMTDNLRAVGLYLRGDFEVEGLRRQCVRRRGTLIDEYFMGACYPRSEVIEQPLPGSLRFRVVAGQGSVYGHAMNSLRLYLRRLGQALGLIYRDDAYGTGQRASSAA